MSTTLAIEVHFDLICPWCLIGKRHLRTALEQFRQLHPDIKPLVAWRSHRLLPAIPVAGVPYQEFYERRLGSAAAVTARRAQVREAARAAGVELAFDRIEFMPNTLLAHQLITCAGHDASADVVADLIERLFTAYFMEGRNIGDISVLTAIAANAGLPAEKIRDCLESPQQRHQLVAQLAAEDDEQVSGVPFFVFNNRLAVSGAHPPASLLAAMEQALLPTAAGHPV